MISFIGGGGSTEATAEEAAEYLSWSPHWAPLMRLTKELGWSMTCTVPWRPNERCNSVLLWNIRRR